MKSSPWDRNLALGVAGLIVFFSTQTQADEPRLQSGADHTVHSHDLYYSEPGPTVQATRDFDGVTEDTETIKKWRPACGSDLGEMTLQQYADFIRAVKAQKANLPSEVMDNPTPHGTGLNLVYTVLGSPPAGAAAAITAVEAYIEPLFADPITVNITISFVNLGGGVLAQTGSYLAGNPGNYSGTVRPGLVNGMDADDTIQSSLPASSVPVRFSSAATVTNVTRVMFTTANWRAAIGAITQNPDADMDVNTAFSFDYDPTNGISAGQTCFRSVLVHETMHALGFDSCTDGFPFANTIMAMDLFRFQRSTADPATLAEFTSFNRHCWMTGASGSDDVNIDVVSVEYQMEDGASGYQAAHFHETGGAPGASVGIMDPALNPNSTFSPNYLRTSDLAAIDLVGWNYPAVIIDTTAPTPNPMQFASVPTAVNNESITMTAVTATDTQNNTITYFFDYIALLPGANDSGWQSSTVYTDFGLTENTSYTYRVRARDSASTPNETLNSTTVPAITHMIAPSGINVTSVTPTGCTLSAAGTLTNLNQASSGVYFNWVLFPGGTEVGNSGWKQVNSHNVTGLTPDTYYNFRVKARNQQATETTTAQSAAILTLAKTPAAPTIGSATIDVNPNGNPPTVYFAIQCVATTPNDASWLNKFVNLSGAPQNFEEFLTDTEWGVMPLQNLTCGVTYSFAVKAANAEFTETPLGPAANYAAESPAGDCTGDCAFSATGDTSCFVNVLIGVNTDPEATARSDVNNDGETDGRDIAAFVDCATTGCP